MFDPVLALRAIGRRTTLDGSSLAVHECRTAILDDYGCRFSDVDLVRLIAPLVAEQRLKWTASGRLTIVWSRDPALD